MPGRPPVRQLQFVASLLAAPASRDDGLNKILVEKALKNGFIKMGEDGLLTITPKGQAALAEAGKSFAVLVDWDNPSIQHKEDLGDSLEPGDLVLQIDPIALLRGCSTEWSKKFVFLTTKSGGNIREAFESIGKFWELGYTAITCWPTPNAADEKLIQIASILAENPKIKTVVLVSHDTDFEDIVRVLKKKQKKVILASVRQPMPHMAQLADAVVQIRPPKSAEQQVLFKMRNTLHNGGDKDPHMWTFLSELAQATNVLAQDVGKRGFERLENTLAAWFVRRPHLNGFNAWHRRVGLRAFQQVGLLEKREVERVDRDGNKYCPKYYVFHPEHELAKKLLQS